jgi:uncharacterized membrane protein YebE (DUF533 family)
MNESKHLLTAIKTWAAVAWADGKLVEAERVTMKALIATARLTDAERTIAAAYLDEPVKLSDLALERIPPGERLHIYSVACGVSAMDQDIAKAERVFLDRLAAALELSPDDAIKARAGAGL